jgi:hypothetical protein
MFRMTAVFVLLLGIALMLVTPVTWFATAFMFDSPQSTGNPGLIALALGLLWAPCGALIGVAEAIRALRQSSVGKLKSALLYLSVPALAVATFLGILLQS